MYNKYEKCKLPEMPSTPCGVARQLSNFTCGETNVSYFFLKPGESIAQCSSRRRYEILKSEKACAEGQKILAARDNVIAYGNP